MRIEDQVVSLELAKLLKELGIKQDSLFYWCQYNSIVTQLHYCNEMPCVENYYSAFTVAELGEMLPDVFVTYRIDNHWECGWEDKKWSLQLLGKFKSEEKTEADARAKMLIYLIENGLIEVPK